MPYCATHATTWRALARWSCIHILLVWFKRVGLISKMLVWFQKCWSDFKNVGLIEYDFFPEEARISCGECLGNWIVTWNIPESELVDTKEGSNSRSQSAVWVFRIENPGIENQNLPTFYHLPRASFSFWGAAASRILRIYIMRTDRIIDIYRIFWRVYRKNLPRTFLRASDLQRSFWRSAYDAMPNNLVRWNRVSNIFFLPVVMWERSPGFPAPKAPSKCAAGENFSK